VQHDAVNAGSAADAAQDELAIAMQGSLAVITLNRPRALNALNASMRTKLAGAYPRFARDPQNYAVVIEAAAGSRAFCAGGDVRELAAWGRADKARARQAFAEEYALDWLHECFSKPTVSLIDGAVMGSGAGITLYGTHRVAGAGYRFAMPECAIGLFPDVGTAHALARMPDEVGMYLALTGRPASRADALALNLVTHCIPAARYAEIKAALVDTWPVDPLLDERHEDPGPGELAPLRETIARCFSAPTIEGIIERLAATAGPNRDWAQSVVADLRARAPLSLKVTHRHLREAKARDLRQTLKVDYRLACRFLDGSDFYEGVRAALIDKDGKPCWRPARLEDVSPAMVEDCFADMGAGELALPTRQEMQAARV
jgi:enoyl-CoA hydratase